MLYFTKNKLNFLFLLIFVLSLLFSYSTVSAEWSPLIKSQKKNWRGITTSADGNKVFAVVYDGYIHTSNDGGANWVERTSAGKRNWWHIDTTADGNKIIAGSVTSDYLYVSNNAGVTWTPLYSFGIKKWLNVEYTDDGNKIMAISDKDIYISEDGGNTFKQYPYTTGPVVTTDINSSYDGNKVVISVYYDYIYTSDDGGINWTKRTSAGQRNWNQVTVSSNGNQIVATSSQIPGTGSGGDYVYISTNGGTTWTPTILEKKFWMYTSSSSDGQKLVAIPNGVSSSSSGGGNSNHSDYAGASWYQYPLSLEWRGISMSGNGNVIYASTYSNYIYKYEIFTPPPTLSLSATPSNVAYNAPTNITWTTTNATSCTASNNKNNINWTGNPSTSGSRIISNMKEETTFNLSCTGPGGTVEQSVKVTVNAEAPTVNLSASPISVVSGESTNLTWTSTNATSCTAGGDWTDGKPLNSTTPETISNITTNKTFTLTCKNAQNVETTSSVSVSVILPISVTLTASPTSVASGDSTQLTWTTTNNPTTCTASGDWTGNKAATGGSQVIMSITEDKTFTITCTKGALTASASSATSSATVKVLAPLNVTLTANPNPLAEGGNVTLTWNGDNADSCVASSTPSTTWSGNRPSTGGTEVVTNLKEDTNFTITCTKDGVNKSKSVLVEIVAVPSLTFSSSPTSVLKGKDITLTWLPKNVEECTASGGWTGIKNKNGGSQTITGISENTTFSLACTGPGGNVIKTITVTVIRESILLTNTRVLQGKTVLKWNAINVENCKATTENPDSGMGWSGNKPSTPSPYTGQTTGVSVLKVSPDTTRYVLTCTGSLSKTEFYDDVFLHTTSPDSNGKKLPVYNEN